MDSACLLQREPRPHRIHPGAANGAASPKPSTGAIYRARPPPDVDKQRASQRAGSCKGEFPCENSNSDREITVSYPRYVEWRQMLFDGADIPCKVKNKFSQTTTTTKREPPPSKEFTRIFNARVHIVDITNGIPLVVKEPANWKQCTTFAQVWFTFKDPTRMFTCDTDIFCR